MAVEIEENGKCESFKIGYKENQNKVIRYRIPVSLFSSSLVWKFHNIWKNNAINIIGDRI